MPPPRPRLKLLRSLWGVVVQEPQALDPLLASTTTTRSKLIPSTLDHKLFPSRQALFRHLKSHGFAGVEASLPDLGATRAERQAYTRALADAGLELVLGIYSSWQVGGDGGGGGDVSCVSELACHSVYGSSRPDCACAPRETPKQDYEGPAAVDHYKPVAEHLQQFEEQLREVRRRRRRQVAWADGSY